MRYTKITYKYDKKENRYRFFYEAEYFENGRHVQSGNYFDVYSVKGYFVALRMFSSKPVYASATFEELIDYVEKETKCVPIKI